MLSLVVGDSIPKYLHADVNSPIPRIDRPIAFPGNSRHAGGEVCIVAI